jgi:hypothetical protein
MRTLGGYVPVVTEATRMESREAVSESANVDSGRFVSPLTRTRPSKRRRRGNGEGTASTSKSNRHQTMRVLESDLLFCAH